MKRNIYKIIITTIILLLGCSTFAQVFEVRALENDYGYLEVQIRETSGTGTPTTTIPIAQISFEIRWSNTSTADVAILCSSNQYTIGDGMGTKNTKETYFWRNFVKTSAVPVYAPSNWVQNEWETLAVLYVTGASGTTDFEVAPSGWVPQDLVWSQGNPATPYFPTPNGSATNYSYPTTVYNYVWTGLAGGPPTQNNGYKWENTANWASTCSGDPLPEGSYPYFGQVGAYVLIPAGVSKYPELSTNTDAYGWSCNKLFIENGAHITVPDLTTSNPANPELYVNGDMVVEGTLNLSPKGHSTVTGSTTINSAEGIAVQSTATGTGSFIDNGTITYGGSGSAKVQTYLSNSAGSGNFDIHLVGPTVDEENYTGAGTGAFLSAFNVVSGSTYAYSWDETQILSNGWQNINSLSYEVRTADGIGLSTIDNLPHTLEMTGTLMTGALSTPALTFSNNHYELISNPYPSSIDFDGLAVDNSGVANNAYWIWNPATNSYVERAGGVGGTQYIQVGQGFFVETNSAGTFNFSNARRAHSTVAFRETMTNMLSVAAEGGKPGYRDDAIIRFDEQATSGYDVNMEAVFWESQNSDATSLRSVAEGNLELAINALPLESLTGGEMLSVPLNFDCGYATEYSLTFTDIETFEAGTEIWLEDKLTGGDWIPLNTQPVVTFTGSPDDAADRFILHFFGPTGMDELAKPTVDIYSFGQHAYVRNNTDETIREVRVYSLSGSLVRNLKTTDQKLLKLWVGDQMAYYVITVVTDQQVYTEKIFINK
jgi:hypothetical protein